MSGAIFSDINPATTSGNDLATLLNSFKDIIASGFSGTTRPVNLVAGGYWIDTTVSTAWLFKIFDGTDDITVYTINPVTNTVSIAGASGSFSLSQISADAVGPILSFLKKRIATNGQTLVGDSLGEAHFKSTRTVMDEITSGDIRIQKLLDEKHKLEEDNKAVTNYSVTSLQRVILNIEEIFLGKYCLLL